MEERNQGKKSTGAGRSGTAASARARARGRRARVRPEPGAKTSASRPTRSAKGRKPRSAKKKLIERLAAISPRTVMLLILFLLFVVLSVSPVTRNLEATARLKKMEGEFKKQQEVTESLQREVAEAGTLDYVEKEARKQRLVAPGEILYLVTTDGENDEVEYRVKALQSMHEAWARVRQMLYSIPRGQ